MQPYAPGVQGPRDRRGPFFLPVGILGAAFPVREGIGSSGSTPMAEIRPLMTGGARPHAVDPRWVLGRSDSFHVRCQFRGGGTA